MIRKIVKGIVLVIGVMTCGFGIGLIGSMGIMYYLFEYLNVSI
jgi:hypothetical protein